MQIISNVALISINETLVVQLISFLIFLLLINRIMFRPLRRTMDERERYVQRIHRDIRETEDRIDAILRENRSEEVAVKKTAAALSAELEAAGNETAFHMIREARAEIEAKQQSIRSEMASRLEEQRRHLAKEAGVLALHLMEKVLDRKVAS